GIRRSICCWRMLCTNEDRVTADSYARAELIAGRCAVKGRYSDSPLLCPYRSVAHENVGRSPIVVRVCKTRIAAAPAHHDGVVLNRHGEIAEEIAARGVAGGKLLLLAPLSVGIANKNVSRPRVNSLFIIACRADDRCVAAKRDAFT